MGVSVDHWKSNLYLLPTQYYIKVIKEFKMLRVLTAAVFVSTVMTDGPGGHHGHHGAHHGVHHGDHGAGHGVHHATHGVSLGHTQQVGGVISVSPVTPVHHAHVVHNAPVHAVHSSFSVQAEPHHAAVHNVPVVPVVKAETNTIADMVATNPKFSTLFTAVQTAGLTDVLKSAGPFTVFAPTNTAFDKVPVDQLNALLADKEKLKGVLLRHVVTGSNMQGKNIPPGSTTLKTAGGEDITATRDKFIQINSSAGSAYIVLFDQLASNGVVHAVDTVF